MLIFSKTIEHVASQTLFDSQWLSNLPFPIVLLSHKRRAPCRRPPCVCILRSRLRPLCWYAPCRLLDRAPHKDAVSWVVRASEQYMRRKGHPCKLIGASSAFVAPAPRCTALIFRGIQKKKKKAKQCYKYCRVSLAATQRNKKNHSISTG